MNPAEALKKIASGCTTDPAATAQDALDRMAQPTHGSDIIGKRCGKPECARMPHGEHVGVLLPERVPYNEAEARLIEAAADLHAALKGLEPWAQGALNAGIGLKDWRDGLADAIVVARAALARAVSP